jgi:hypothetical protein
VKFLAIITNPVFRFAAESPKSAAGSAAENRSGKMHEIRAKKP